MCDAAFTTITSRRSSLNTNAELSLNTLLHASHCRTISGGRPGGVVGVQWPDINPVSRPAGRPKCREWARSVTNAQPKEGSAVRSRWKKRRGRVKRGKVCALSRQRSPNCDIIRKSTMSYLCIDYSYFQRTFVSNPSTSSVLVQDGLFRDWRRRGIPTPATKHRPASQYEGRAFVGVVLSALSLTLSRVC